MSFKEIPSIKLEVIEQKPTFYPFWGLLGAITPIKIDVKSLFFQIQPVF